MEKKISNWNAFWYAMYAFAGLGLEVVLIGFLEPLLFGGVKSSAYTPTQTIIHWLLTILCWGLMSYLLIRSAKKNLDFRFTTASKPTPKGFLISAVLVAGAVVLNAFDWGGLKIVEEFQKKGPILFSFQYLYYFVEMVLVYLIVAFGQKFAENLLHRESRFPWGGLLLCCTWGAVHILSKGSLATGIGTMFFSLVFGMVYLLLKRNPKYAYLAMTMAFII